MTSLTKEEILGPSLYPHECSSMVEVQPHEFVLKAMDEYAAQCVSDFKEKLKAKLKEDINPKPLFLLFDIINEL